MRDVNVNKLMTMPLEEFEAWLNTASQEEIDATMVAIRKHRAELVREETRIADVYCDEFKEARVVIDRIKNGKIS
jgi:hypothetical protein